MFNKFSRTCALSDELENGNFFHSPLFRFLSFSVCLAFMLGIFTLMPFPVSAVSDGLVIDGKNCASINGYPIIGANHFNNKSLLAVRDFYNQCSIFLVCSYNGHYYLPVSTVVPQINIHGSNVEYIYFYGFGSEGDTTLQLYSSGQEKYKAWLEKICARAVVSSDTVTVSFRSYSSTIKKLYDFNGNDVSDTINPTDCCYYWAVNPNFVWTSSSGSMMRSDIMTHSDGSGFVPASSAPSRARFNCFGNYNEVTYSEIENKYTIGHFKKKTVTDDKWGKLATRYYFSSSTSLASDFPDYASRYISFSYFNGTSSTDGITIRIDAINGMVSKDFDDIVDINTYICTTYTFIPCVALYSSSSMSSVPSNTTVYYKMDLANALNGLNRVYTYVLSIYQNSDNKLLTSTCINWRGATDEVFGMSSIGVDGNGIIESSIESTSTGDSVDDIVLVPDNNGNMQDDLLIADDIQPENKFLGFDLNDLNATDIFGTLQQSTSNIGSFFQSCFNIIPTAIISILTAALTLLVILRILGR